MLSSVPLGCLHCQAAKDLASRRAPLETNLTASVPDTAKACGKLGCCEACSASEDRAVPLVGLATDVMAMEYGYDVGCRGMLSAVLWHGAGFPGGCIVTGQL